MNGVKKKLSLILAATLAVGLCACGGKDATTPSFVICTKSYYGYDEEIERQMFEGEVQGVILAEESKDAYPALYDALMTDWKKELKAADDSAVVMQGDARDQYDDMLSYGSDVSYFYGYEQKSSASVHRVDEKVFSYSENYYDYMGGAHGMYGDSGHTYDVQTGKELKLSDIVTDLDAYGQLLFDKVSVEYPDVVSYLDDITTLRDQIVEEVKMEDVATWELEPDGIVYFFNPYDIAAYASGQQIAMVGYDEAPELFNPAYLPDGESDYITSPIANNQFYLDLDGDGDYDPLYYSANYNYIEGEDGYDGYSEYNGFTISTNSDAEGTSLAEDLTFYDLNASCARFMDGKTYLLMECGLENDYHIVVVCEVADGNVKETGRYYVYAKDVVYDNENNVYGSYAYTDPANMECMEHFDRLGTYHAGGRYHLTKDGIIEALSDYAYISENSRPYMFYTSKVSMMADIVDEAGNVTEEGVEFPAGTNVTLYRTSYPSDADDGWEDCLIDAHLDDGRIIRFHYSYDADGNRLVNGIEEFSLFDNIMYAG